MFCYVLACVRPAIVVALKSVMLATKTSLWGSLSTEFKVQRYR